MEVKPHEEVHCHASWLEVAQILNLSDSTRNKWWSLLVDYFHEQRRHYHTFEHLYELLILTQKHKHLITNYPVILLSIFFHDIVYNPQSPFNEEDSNDVFLQFVMECNSQQVSSISNQVFAIIQMTKSHKLPPSADFDTQFFSDIDMGILGSNSTRYAKYAAQIRLEYNFVEFNAFCTKRSDFLSSCLSSDQPIFSTDLFQQERGQQALDNIAWEHNLLKTFQCPVELWKQRRKGYNETDTNADNSDNAGDGYEPTAKAEGVASRERETETEKAIPVCSQIQLLLHVLVTTAVIVGAGCPHTNSP